MPVALAIEATERSISAHRITNVRPTAITPVTEIWVRMLAALSNVAKDELAAPKKTIRAISVTNGAMLRIWLRRNGPIIPPRSSCRLQQPVLADRFAGEFVHNPALLHHHDAVGERQHRLGLGRHHDDGETLVAQATHDAHHVVLGPDIHAARRLAQ